VKLARAVHFPHSRLNALAVDFVNPVLEANHVIVDLALLDMIFETIAIVNLEVQGWWCYGR
jgi:hypothetical protein